MPETDVTAQVAETETTTPAQVAAVVTEEPFDKDRAMATITKLRETEKQAKKDAAELAAFKAEAQKKADADLSETDRLKKQLADQAIETRNTRAENAALAAGLPASFADRLKGSTKSELEADAAEFAKLIPAQSQKPAPKLNTTNPANPTQNETEAQQRTRLFPGSGNIFDKATIEAGGGGVVWNTSK